MIKYICVWLFSVFISSLAQVVLKVAAGREYKNHIQEYVNPLVIGAYAVFFGSIFLTYYALRVVPYAYAPVIESASYIFIPVFSVLLLHEKISRRRLIGIGIMLIGVLIFAL